MSRLPHIANQCFFWLSKASKVDAETQRYIEVKEVAITTCDILAQAVKQLDQRVNPDDILRSLKEILIT